MLTHEDGTLDESRIARLGEEICQILDAGRRVVLVSSGAVGAGMSQLGLTQRPQDVARLQAVAAVGQARSSKSTTARSANTDVRPPRSC